MEAMTKMGMAASQARFLGLTARKSNVEYQGQQINQQRTALSNESANLYNQMMDITVPVPPSQDDFYITTYTLDGSKESYATGDYQITDATKTYIRDGQYNVTLSYQEEKLEGRNIVYSANYRSLIEEADETDENKTNKYRLSFVDKAISGNYFTTNLTYDESDTNPFEKDSEGNDKFKVTPFQLYKIDENAKIKVKGYDEWYNSLDKDEKKSADTATYFYRDKAGQDYFLTKTQFDILNKDDPKDGTVAGNVTVGSYNTYSKEYTTTVIADLEKTSKGRYSSITIANDETYPAILQGATFSISTKRVKDEDAYEAAYNDYEFEKAQYEKRISDLNAKTEIIQRDDQQLELRLQQLNTEQEAIKTEMDSVSKVIEDNVQQTFKTFA